MVFLGADVHVRNSYLYATDGVGRRLMHGRVANVMDEMRQFMEMVRSDAGLSDGSMRLVLESTTNSRAVRGLLRQAAQSVGFESVQAEVLDARKLRIIAESVCKCDALDARVLSDLARSNLQLPVCYMPDDEEFALREHLRARSDLVRMRTMLKNRIHAILHRRGILTPTGGLFTKDGLAFLEAAPLDEAGRTIADRYQRLLKELEERIAESTRDLRSILRRPRWLKPAVLLQTMPGIGIITALTILAELGDLKRFKSRAAVANYAGLTPIIRDSNTKHYSGGISHRGSAHLRQVLTEAAWAAIRQVPRYQDLFERVSGRRGKSVAIVAVARRMLEDSMSMLWKDEAFRYAPAEDRTGAPRCDRTVASSVAG
jgi:transposase